MPRLSQSFVKGIGSVERDTWFWDDELKGFFVRAWPNAAPVWGIRFRIAGKARTVTIGPCHEVKAERARKRAIELKESARLGKDLTVAEKTDVDRFTIADLAREHQEIHKPPHIAADTFADRKTHWELHILPELGEIPVRELSRADVIKFHLQFEKQPSLGNRLVATLSKALNDSMTFRPPWITANPAARLKKFEEKKRQRILARAEIASVMQALTHARLAMQNHPAWSAPWLYEALMLSGLRLSELAKRTWDQVDLERGTLFIPKTKNKKPRTVSLSTGMIALLSSMPRRSRFVFPDVTNEKPFSFPQHYWQKIRRELGLNDVRLHDLRHTVASYSMHEGGLSQRQVMELLGHSQMSTTERYLNVHDEDKRRISDVAGDTIARLSVVH